MYLTFKSSSPGSLHTSGLPANCSLWFTINFIYAVKYNCSHQIYHDRMAFNGLIPKNKVLLTIVTRMSSSGCPRRRGICGLYRRFRQNSSASTLQQESVQGSLYFWSILSSNGRMIENLLYC